MSERRFAKLWQQLQGKKPHLPHFLAEVSIDGIRGIDDLRVEFDYPVSVIAGGNASGKSTVLFAAACAYKVPGAGVRDFVPSTLFPDYRPRVGERQVTSAETPASLPRRTLFPDHRPVGKRQDDRPKTTIEFQYATPEGRRAMRWRRSKAWSRNFLGRRGATQPERPVYLRTLSNLSNPSEVRSVLGMSHLRVAPAESPLTALQVDFAQRLLPFDYATVVRLSSGAKSLLFAEQAGGAAYSELHMAAGERAILRLAAEIAQLRDALVLIDEVEAGLHPWVQQLLMLQLQQLALLNNLQVLVTTHSPVVLECVPENGRIFLERDDSGKVAVVPAYRDLVQDALYGRSGESLNVLCEDDAAEGILQGVLDDLLPRHRVKRESVRIGRDTGANEFPAHATAFRKFGQIESFVFVLDGDKRKSTIATEIRSQAQRDVPVYYLPSDQAPEMWVWQQLGAEDQPALSEALGIAHGELRARMAKLNAVFDSASDSPQNIAKTKMRSLADALERDVAEVCRVVARLETRKSASDIQPLARDLEEALLRWRS